MVYANARAMCHDENLYKDPDAFNPMRFAPVSEGGNGEPLPLGQFGFGRRYAMPRPDLADLKFIDPCCQNLSRSPPCGHDPVDHDDHHACYDVHRQGDRTGWERNHAGDRLHSWTHQVRSQRTHGFFPDLHIFTFWCSHPESFPCVLRPRSRYAEELVSNAI